MTDSFAEDIGLMEKDVILSINRQPVTSVDDVQENPGHPEAGRPGGVPCHAAFGRRARPCAAMDHLLCVGRAAASVTHPVSKHIQ